MGTNEILKALSVLLGTYFYGMRRGSLVNCAEWLSESFAFALLSEWGVGTYEIQGYFKVLVI